MALQFRRGAAAIEEAATSRSGGSFRPFVPRIDWREDGETKHILVLTPMEEVVTAMLHDFIPVGKGEKTDGEEYTIWESFLSRRDPALDEEYDDLQERLERTPKERSLGVMVELEPVIENSSERKRVKSFAVKTETFTRKTDDGEVEVTAPVIGICTQSPRTLWGTLSSLDASRGPLPEVPVEVIRRGKDQNTRYDVIPFQDTPVDVSQVVEYLDGITYLSDDLDDLINAIEASDSELEQAQAVADALLNRRLEELSDKERYDELVSPLELDDMPKGFGGGGKKKSSAKKTTRAARPARSTRRQTVKETPAEETAPEAEAPAKEPAAETTEASSSNSRFAALKARVEARAS